MKNPLGKGLDANGAAGTGPVTREMVHARARELALIAGRPPPYVTQTDYEQAKRELMGGSDLDASEELLGAQKKPS
jgi:hypothetical protein